MRLAKPLFLGVLLAGGLIGCKNAERGFESKRQEMLDGLGPFIYNTDGCDMFYYPQCRPVSKRTFLALRHDYAKGTTIKTVSYCPLSSGFGFFTLPDVGEFNGRSYDVAWEDIHRSYPKGAKDIHHYNAAERFAEELGTDALQMSVDWCRESACRSFVSLRFNDTHDQDRTYGHVFFPPFKARHPECLMGTKENPPKVCSWTAVNFAEPLVRDRMRRFVRRILEKYDVDGLEIDFFRHCQIFKSVADGGVASEAELDLLTEMMEYVRETSEELGRKRGRPILIAIRTPDSVGYCRAVGIDLERWFSRKLVDVWTSTGYFQHEQWPTTVAFARRHGVRCYASMDESRIPRYAKNRKCPIIDGRGSDANYRGRFAAALAAGCDGLNLFNLEYGRLTELTKDDPRHLIGRDKIYFATERGSGGYRSFQWLVDGDRFNRMPKVDPGEAVKLKPDVPYAFDLMLGEDFAAAEKIGLKPRVTVLALVDEKKAIDVMLNGRCLAVVGEEAGAVALAVDVESVRRGLNAFSVKSMTENVLHDFAVRVTYGPGDERQECVKKGETR